MHFNFLYFLVIIFNSNANPAYCLYKTAKTTFYCMLKSLFENIIKMFYNFYNALISFRDKLAHKLVNGGNLLYKNCRMKVTY